MMRRAFTILTAGSLLLCVAAMVVGARSHWRGSLIGWVGERQTLFARMEYGIAAVHWHRSDAGANQGALGASWAHPAGLGPPEWPEWWQGMGFGYAEGVTEGGNVIRQWRVPLWFIVLCSGGLPVAKAVSYMRRRRWAARGRCSRCGYDLRATPERCPECGTSDVKGSA